VRRHLQSPGRDRELAGTCAGRGLQATQRRRQGRRRRWRLKSAGKLSKKRISHLLGGLEPAGGVFGQRAEHNAHQHLRKGRLIPLRRGGRVLNLLDADLHGGLTIKRQPSVQRFKQNNADRIEITPRIDHPIAVGVANRRWVAGISNLHVVADPVPVGVLIVGVGLATGIQAILATLCPSIREGVALAVEQLGIGGRHTSHREEQGDPGEPARENTHRFYPVIDRSTVKGDPSRR